jgi:hypothetical protein
MGCCAEFYMALLFETLKSMLYFDLHNFNPCVATVLWKYCPLQWPEDEEKEQLAKELAKDWNAGEYLCSPSARAILRS